MHRELQQSKKLRNFTPTIVLRKIRNVTLNLLIGIKIHVNLLSRDFALIIQSSFLFVRFKTFTT